jgi:hypothetical protein
MTLKKLAIVLMENDDKKPSFAGGSIEVAKKGWPADLVDYFGASAQYIAWGGRPLLAVSGSLCTYVPTCTRPGHSMG